MAQKSTQSASGTSFHGDTVRASVNDFIKMFGDPNYEDNTGSDKVNFEWVCETESGDVFTIYDWKEYRRLDQEEVIEWHIGGHNGSVTNQALNEIASMFDEIDS